MDDTVEFLRAATEDVVTRMDEEKLVIDIAAITEAGDQ